MGNKYIKLGGMQFPYKEPPASGSKDELVDLEAVIKQFNDRRVPELLQDMADDVYDIFIKYMNSQGISLTKEDLKPIRDIVKPIVSRLKDYFDRDRPTQCAKRHTVHFNADLIKSAESRSYPSGHTIKAYVMADNLANQYPDLRDDLMKVAEIVAQSRIDRGVHFPSDIEYGKEIAEVICANIRGQN